MKTSVLWLRSLLEPGDLSASGAEAVLTDLGFPIDAHEPVSGWPAPPWSTSARTPDEKDVRLEVEFTSNRGDALAHWPLAKEIAARTGRRLVSIERWCEAIGEQLRLAPDSRGASAAKVHDALKLSADVSITTPPAAGWAPCPRFTARVIRGVKVGPSPAWLVGALESVGQRAISNVVDVTNFINLLLGQPTHAFDLAKLEGAELRVRWAMAGEALRTLDGKSRTLAVDELVVADARRAQSLAGVIGGGDSEVDASTRDVVLEAATWDPLVVRRAARRHQIRTDASHRFERRVHPRTIDLPALLAARLIALLGGGTLLEGVLEVGGPEADARGPASRAIDLRLERATSVLGVPFNAELATSLLSRLGIEARPSSAERLACVVPPERTDLTSEIDLVEELGRLHGFDKIAVHPSIQVNVRPPQPREKAVASIASTLTGLGFFETVTYSFTAPKRAAAFLAEGLETIGVDDERRAHEPTLRPSVLSGLLACRKANQDGQVEQPGGVRLFEIASTFAQRRSPGGGPPTTVETRVLAMLIDVQTAAPGKPASMAEVQHAVRLLRGAIEAIAGALSGTPTLECVPGEPACKAYQHHGHARIAANVAGHSRDIGSIGVIDPSTLKLFGLDVAVVGCELDVEALISMYPPKADVAPLPAFPSVERDLSLIVPETLRWAELRRAIEAAPPARMERLDFVGVYRGPQVGDGKKSVTVRVRFRDSGKTLRREEVDPDLAGLVERLGRDVGATLRA